MRGRGLAVEHVGAEREDGGAAEHVGQPAGRDEEHGQEQSKQQEGGPEVALEHDDPEGDPVRLEDDIPFCEPFLYCPGRLVVLNEEEGSAVVGKMSLDPYFSHFVLVLMAVRRLRSR